jgi:glutaredoxin
MSTGRIVTLYTKPGCHLCEAVEQVIRRVAARRTFEFVSQNIESDPASFEKYKHDIPVVTVDGVEIARHRLTAEQLERALNRQ